MTNSERLKKSMQIGESRNTLSPASASNSSRLQASMASKEYGFDTLGRDEAYVRKLITDSYGGWQDKTTLNANYAQVQGIANRLNAYKQNGSQASPDLDKIIDFYNGALSNWDKMAETYGNFANADAYNKAVRQNKLEKKYAGKNYDQIQRAIAKASENEERDFLQNYSAYSDEDSFQRAIEGAYNDDYKKKLEGAYSNFRDAHAWDRYSDITQNEDFNSAVDGVKKVGDSYMFEADLIRSGRGNNVEVLNKMTDEEKQVAAYIYQKDGIDAVADYLSDMGMLVGKRYYDDKVSEEAQKIEETEGWQGAGLNAWYSVRDALINAIGSAGATGEVIQSYASGKDYNPYIGMSGWSNRAGETTAAISNEITDVTSPVLGDSKFNLASMAYNAVVSDLASKAGQFALGQMYTPLMGGSAYASTYKDAIEKGLDKNSAKLTALASGAAEVIFEYISFDKLQSLQPKNADSIKTVAKNMAKQFAVEGSEEVWTDIANMVTDFVINGDMSEISGIYQSYINAGYDQNSAKLYTMLAKGGDVLESFIVGGMSGAMGAGLASARGYASNKEMGANADRDLLSKAFEGNEELTRRFNEADTDAKVGALMGDVYRESMDNSVDALANYIMGNSDVSKRKAIKLAEASLRSGFAANDEGVQKTIEENSRIAKGVNESVRTAKEKAKAEAKAKAFNEKADVSKFNVTEDAELSKVTDINGDTLTVNGEEKPVSEVAMNVDQANIVSIASTLSGAEKETYLEMYRGQDSEAYDDIFKMVWDSAMNGIDINDIRSAFRTETLFTGNEIDKIYLSALKVREAEGIKNYEARKALTANLKNNFKSGRFDDSNLKKQNYVITDEKQRVAYEIAKVFSKLGANVRVIYDVSIAGKHSADNGFFTSKGNVVTINLAAKYNVNDTTDKGYAINTLAHEFTHFIEYNNKEGFETIRNALVRVYGEKKWEQLKNDNARLYGIKSAKEAESEAVARACEDMLNSPETMDMILSKMNANEIKTFRDAVKSFFDHLISMWKKVANTFSSEAPASKALAKEIDHYEEIRSLWVDALTEALKTAQATEKDLKAIGMEMRNGYVYNVLSAQTLEKSDYMTDVKKASESLAKAQGISVKKAKEQIQNMLRARDIILSDEERLNYTSIEGKSAWVSNPEYGGNLDFSFLCPKRLPYTGTLNAIMHKHPKLNFSVDNFLWLRRALIEEGVDAPCPYCFVESSRARFGKYNDRFLQIAKEEKLAYIPTNEELLNPDALEKMRSEHPETYDRYQKFLGTLAQRKPKMLEERRAYDGDILRVFGKGDDKIDEKNLHGGIRFNAFSDFEIVHMLDCMQAIADMARIGLAGFAYTKQKAFAEIFGQTGLKINLSCAAKGVDADGRIIFDDVEGMNHNDAEELRNKYSQNVGICCVVFSEEQLEAALIDDRIDYVLPFHRSQWSKKEYARMGLSVDTKDFTRFQTEKQGVEGTRKVADGNMPFLSYWNDQLSGRENVEKYLDLCNRNDIRPLFSFLLDFEDGKWQIPEGGRRQKAAENYWKVLTEFKMFDNDGNHIAHTAVRADFNMEAAERLLNEYDGSHTEFPVNQSVVDHFDKYMKNGKSGYEFEKDFELNSKQIDPENIPAEKYEEMKSHFGTTTNFNVAGYMLKDGTMLDFSGKHWGDTSSTFRQVDHRDIQEVLDDPEGMNGVGSMIAMISNGNIRLMPENGGINLSEMPNEAQMKVLERYIQNRLTHEDRIVTLDFDEHGGDTVYSKFYEAGKGVSAQSIIADIRDFFENGQRAQSTVAQFHNMYSKQLDETEAEKVRTEAISDKKNIESAEKVIGKQCDDWLKGVMPSKHYFDFGMTPYILREKGVRNLPITMNEDGILKFTSDYNDHSVDLDVIRKMPSLISKPLMVFSGSIPNSYVLIIDADDKHFQKVVVAIHINNKQNRIDVNRIASVYGKGNTARYAVSQIQAGNLLDADIKRSLQWITRARVQFPSLVQSLLGASKDTVALMEQVVNDSEKDALHSRQFDDDKELIKKKFGSESGTTVFSKQLDDNAYEILGENKRLAKENDKLRKDVERLADALKLSKTLTHGKVLKPSQVEAAAESIKKLANSTYDTKTLAEELKGLYGYLLENSSEKDKYVDFDEFMGRAYDIAGRVLAESKGNKTIDPYYKGLLNNFRGTRIRLTEEQIQEAKNAYGDNYRDAFMGSVILAKNGTSLDSLWQEWSSQYPELFAADTNPNDMPTALLEAIGTIRNSATIVESYNTQEARMQLAYDIYNKFWNVDTVRTYADKAMAEHRKAMAELKSDYKTRLEKQALQKDWEKAKVIHEVKKQRDQKLADYKEYVKKRKLDEKEASEKRVLIRKITDTSAELNKWLLANNKDKHVPEGLKVPLASLLDAIDFSSKQMYNTGVPTRRDISFINALERMHTMIMQESEALTTADGMTELDLTSDFAQSVDALYKDISHVERQVREDNGYILQAMSADELSRLYDMIKVLKHSITQMNKMISSSNAHRMDTVALKTIGDAKELGETRTPEAIRRYDYGEALPYYTFKRMGEGGKIVFENFMDGQDTMAFHAREIKDYAESVYSDKQVKEWEKDIREFTVGDKTFEITVPQIMSLYCLSKRDQARQHILQGGIRIDEFKKGFKKVNQTQNINLSASDLSEIIGTLTDEQREVADRLQEFLNTTCSDWGNEITMKRFGIKGFTEKNYFPIRSNDAKLQSDAKDRSASLYALLNMSFTKGLVVKANNQIIVSDVFDVFAKHSSDMARYNAFSLPVLDLIRWWNYKVHSDNERGFEDETVKSALEATFGREMNHYIRTFIDDVNGTKEKGRMDNLSSKMLTAYKIAAVGANLQVALLQPISYIRAAYVIDQKYLTQGLLRKPNTNDARQYVGMMVWKDMGFFELDVTNGLQDIIKHADTAGDKIKELSMKGAELGDTLTWGFLWNACEAEVADKRHDLVRGSEEFKKAVAKRMREVIYSTQVVDSVFTRSQFMRGGDMYTKMLTAFLSEPTLSLNVLRDAYEGYAQDVKRYGKAEAWKRNGKNIGMAFGTYVICAVVESTLRGVIGKLRDPEDEEIGKLIWDNVKSELNPLGKLPYFKDIVEMMEGYSPTRMDESVIQQGVWTYKAIVKGEWDYATWYKIFKFSSQVSGLPLSNAMREATTIWNDTAGLMYPSIRIE